MAGQTVLQVLEVTLPPMLGAAMAAFIALIIHRHLGRRRDAADIRRRMAVAKAEAPQFAVIEGRQTRQQRAWPAQQLAEWPRSRSQVA